LLSRGGIAVVLFLVVGFGFTAWRDSLTSSWRKMAETRNDFFRITEALHILCNDAQIHYVREFYNPDGFREASELYAASAAVDHIEASIEIYSRSLPAILKFGGDAIVQLQESENKLDRQFAGVLEAEVVGRLGNGNWDYLQSGEDAYSDRLFVDYWGAPCRFFVGPWPEEYGPVVFRCYARKYPSANVFATSPKPKDNSAPADELTVVLKGQERGVPADGLREKEPEDWTSSESYIRDVYIWSYGANGVSDQPRYDPSQTYDPPSRQYYRKDASDAYLGGGDDINNWDSLLSFGVFYSED
jgi:hypothetical protein